MKQRFTETFIYDKRTFNKIKKVKGSSLAESRIKRVLKEKKILDESNTSSRNYYEFPISKYDYINANNRTYSKKLWENVIKNQKAIWEGGLGLADHPENEGSFKDSAIVWTGMRLSENDNLVYATGSFVGPYGKMCEEIIDAGGRVGFSSSGFGELLDESTVDPDTYEIERVADVVLNPSQGVFGDSSHIQKESTNSITESSKRKEKTPMASTKISKIEEKKFKKDVKVFMEEAKKRVDPRLRMEELKDIKVYLEDNQGFDSSSQLTEEISNQIKSTELEIKKFIDSSIDLKENLGVDSSEELKEKLAMIHEDSKTLKSNAKDWEKISETLAQRNKRLKLQLQKNPSIKEQKALIATVRKLEKDNKVLLGKFRTFEKGARKANGKMKNAYKQLGEKFLALTENLDIEQRKNKHLIRENLKLKDSEKARLNSIKESKKMKLKEEMLEKKAKQDPLQRYVKRNFSENSAVEKYYADLVLTHGKEIAPFRSKILDETTVKGAMNVYFRIREGLTQVERVPESSLIGNKTRNKLLEDKGIKLVESKSKLASMPKGWE